MNISSSSCTSQDSAAILSSNMDLPSSFSSSSFSTFTSGGRAIDRHNPIITDEKRSGNGGSCTTTPIRTPCTNNVLQQKPTNTPVSVTTPKKPHQSSPKQKKNKFTNKLITKKKTAAAAATTTTTEKTTPISSESSNKTDITIEGDHDDDDESSYCGRRGYSKPSDLIMKATVCSNTKPSIDYVSPPESSRYLLDDNSFLKVLSDFDPVLKLMPYDSSNNNNSSNHNAEVGYQSPQGGCRPPKPSASSDQVVVLRVSLHCRGCERKMKKHLSRMPGVTSFNIDFAAKKVTVVGDVTPLGVLASISKVKTAKLWTPAVPSSPQLNSKNMQIKI